jgi:hypothetical protein
MLIIQNYDPDIERPDAARPEPEHGRVHLSHLLTVDATPMGSQVELLARFDGEVMQPLYQTQHVISQLWNIDSNATVRGIDLLCPEDRQKIAQWNDYPVEAT